MVICYTKMRKIVIRNILREISIVIRVMYRKVGIALKLGNPKKQEVEHMILIWGG